MTHLTPQTEQNLSELFGYLMLDAYADGAVLPRFGIASALLRRMPLEAGEVAGAESKKDKIIFSALLANQLEEDEATMLLTRALLKSAVLSMNQPGLSDIEQTNPDYVQWVNQYRAATSDPSSAIDALVTQIETLPLERLPTILQEDFARIVGVSRTARPRA